MLSGNKKNKPSGITFTKPVSDDFAGEIKVSKALNIAAIIAASIAMIILAVDLYKDVQRYDSLDEKMREADIETIKLNKDLLGAYEKNVNQQLILDCLQKKNKKYWEYPECFE